MDVVGGTSLGSNTSVAGTVTTGANPIIDPLTDLPTPPNGPVRNPKTISASGTYPPAYYSGGIDLSGQSAVTLQSGVYVLGGAGLSTSGGAGIVTAPGGVLIYLASGGVSLQGNGVTTIAPMTTGPYAGVSIFQARDNTSADSIKGTPGLNVSGTVYLPGAPLSVSGNAGVVATQIIASTVAMNGNGTLTVNYNGRFPIPGNRVFLVR